MELAKPNPHRLSEIFIVTTPDSPEFSLLRSSLRHSSVVALDTEWKPIRSRPDETGCCPSFPTVTLLQIACRICSDSEYFVVGSCPVFLVDLLSLPFWTVWEILREMFVSPSVLKLGFRFKQDFVYLSSTFYSQDCFLGFDEVEPFIDITSIYYYMKYQNSGKKLPKDTISLATICSEILNISLSKELQCSDWSCRPLTEGQISYAAADAYYLLEIFAVFEQKFRTEGKYYVVDAGYPLQRGYLKPYPETRYHLPDFARGTRPVEGLKETFNQAHSSLRSVIERTFGVWKKKWAILKDMHSYSFAKQADIVMATMAVHNFIRRHPSQMDQDFSEWDDDHHFDAGQLDVEGDREPCTHTAGGVEEMNSLRASIAQQLYDARR